MRSSPSNHNVSPTAFTLRAILYFICQSYFKKYVTEKTPSISHATVRYLPLYHWHILRCHLLKGKQIYKQILINKPATAVLSRASHNFNHSSVGFFELGNWVACPRAWEWGGLWEVGCSMVMALCQQVGLSQSWLDEVPWALCICLAW